MDINSGVNPSQSEPVRLSIETETITYNRQPPPPYSAGPIPVTNQPVIHEIVVQTPLKNSKPTFRYCHECGLRVLTRVEYLNSRKTHLFAGFVCGLTFWCLLCCLAAIPYLLKACKKAHHYCPNCNTFLGAYSKV